MTPSEAITILLGRGMTEASIGETVGARQSTINKIKRGDMIPNWETGKALVELAEAEAKASTDTGARPKAA